MPPASFGTARVPAMCTPILRSQESWRTARDQSIEYLAVTFDHPESSEQGLVYRRFACAHNAHCVRCLGLYHKLPRI